jgi:hypothetical protein
MAEQYSNVIDILVLMAGHNVSGRKKSSIWTVPSSVMSMQRLNGENGRVGRDGSQGLCHETSTTKVSSYKCVLQSTCRSWYRKGMC